MESEKQESLPLAPPEEPRAPLTAREPESSRWALEYYHNSADQGRVFRKMLETLAALTALVLGLQFLLIPRTVLDLSFLPNDNATLMGVWGIVMLSLGLSRIIILIVNGWWPLTALVRKWLAVGFLVGVWMPLLTGYAWNFWEAVTVGSDSILVGMPFALFCVGIEFLIFYAHASFILIEKRASGDGRV